MKTKIAVAFYGFLAILTVIALVIGQHCGFHLSRSQRPFDSESWRAADIPVDGIQWNTSKRKHMMADLVNNVLPDATRSQLLSVLGPSPTHADFRRHTPADRKVRIKNPDGTWKPYPRTGKGYYFDEYGWDLIYPLGYECTAIWDLASSPEEEYLMIRFDQNDRFASWYVFGSSEWPKIVGSSGSSTYSVRP